MVTKMFPLQYLSLFLFLFKILLKTLNKIDKTCQDVMEISVKSRSYFQVQREILRLVIGNCRKCRLLLRHFKIVSELKLTSNNQMWTYRYNLWLYTTHKVTCIYTGGINLLPLKKKVVAQSYVVIIQTFGCCYAFNTFPLFFFAITCVKLMPREIARNVFILTLATTSNLISKCYQLTLRLGY